MTFAKRKTPAYVTDGYHGFKHSLMLVSHFVKLINATAALIGKYQGTRLKRMVTARAVFT